MSWFFYAVALAILVVAVLLYRRMDGEYLVLSILMLCVPLLVCILARTTQISPSNDYKRTPALMVANEGDEPMSYDVSQETLLTSRLVSFTLQPGESRYFSSGYGDFKLLRKRPAAKRHVVSEYDRLVKSES